MVAGPVNSAEEKEEAEDNASASLGNVLEPAGPRGLPVLFVSTDRPALQCLGSDGTKVRVTASDNLAE